MVNFINGVYRDPNPNDSWVKMSEADKFDTYFGQKQNCFTDESTSIDNFRNKLDDIISKAESDQLGALLGKTGSGRRNLQNLIDALNLSEEYRGIKNGSLNPNRFKQAIRRYNDNLERVKVKKYAQEIQRKYIEFNNQHLVLYADRDGSGNFINLRYHHADYVSVEGYNLAGLKNYVASVNASWRGLTDYIDTNKRNGVSLPEITEERDPDTY